MDEKTYTINHDQLREYIALMKQKLSKIEKDHLSMPSLVKENLRMEIEALEYKLNS